MLKPPDYAPAGWTESILAVGPPGSGKSRIWAAMRSWYELTGTEGHFHILETEVGMAMRTSMGYRSGEPGKNFDQNATIWPVNDYDSLLDASKKILDLSLADTVDTPFGPWTPHTLVVDSIGFAHTWSRDKWFMGNKQVTWQEFMASGRGVQEVKHHQWGEMTGHYRDWLVPYVLQYPGNRIATAHMAEIRTEGSWAEKNKNILSLWGPYGVKPVGDNDLAYGFQAVLLCTRERSGWAYTTVDDNEREFLDRTPVVDFVSSYLMPVAGWQV